MLSHIFISFIVFSISMIIAPYYIYGDPAYYRKVYLQLGDMDLFDGFIYYSSKLSSIELIHFIISWIFSSIGASKDIVMSISNSILAYASLVLLKKMKVSLLISMLIVVTNYYYYVIYFSAERLKFGFLFLILSVLFKDKVKRLYAYSALAVLSHVQMIIIYFTVLFQRGVKGLIQFLKNWAITKTTPLLLFIVFVLLSGIWTVLRQQFIAKYDAYFGYGGFHVEEIVKSMIFMLASLFYSKNKAEVFLSYLPILIVAFIISGDRVNMIAYFIFLAYALQYKSGKNIGVIGSIVYFAIKAYYYVQYIIKYGNGFFN